MSICDPKTLTNLYDWLESIPFSRTKKNFARDFSDGILAAELIKYFFPNLVEMHNYPASNSLEQKKTNWSILNQKVLRKLDFPLSLATISDLASGSKREATEYFLYTLREKIEAYMNKAAGKVKQKRDYLENARKADIYDRVIKETLDMSKDSGMCENGIGEIGSGVLEKETLGECKAYFLGDSNLDYVPRVCYEQKVQELLACQETIQILKARIERLENTLQLKNVTIDRQQNMLEKLKGTQTLSIEKVKEKKSLEKKF